jgi:hypothetical protein
VCATFTFDGPSPADPRSDHAFTTITSKSLQVEGGGHPGMAIRDLAHNPKPKRD